MPIYIGTRAFRRLAIAPAVVLLLSAAGQLIFLLGPDLPNGDVWRKVGYLGLILSLVAVISPVALISVVAAAARRLRGAWSIRACDVALTAQGVVVVGGPAHGFSTSWSALAAGGVRRTGEGLVLRGDGAGGAWLTIPWPNDADERASLEALGDTLTARVAQTVLPQAVREPPETLHCHECAAPLRPASTTTVICGHCQAENALSPALVEKVRATETIAARRRRERLLAQALLRQGSARAANFVAIGGGLVMMVASFFVLMFSAALAFADGLEAGLPRIAGLALVEMALALAMLGLSFWWLSNRRALRLLTFGFSAVAPRRPGEPPGCRECGGPLPDLGSDHAVASCVYCGTPSVIAADLRPHAAAQRRAECGKEDAWAVLRACGRRRRASLTLVGFAAALALGGFLWLRHDQAIGAVADTSRAVEIAFDDTRATASLEAWRLRDGVGVAEMVARWDKMADPLVFARAGVVDVLFSSEDTTRWIQDVAGEKAERTVPGSVKLAAALDGEGHFFVDGAFQRFEDGALERLDWQPPPGELLIDAAEGPAGRLWLTSRGSRHGHLRIASVPGAGSGGALLVDAREPALSPDGSTLAFAQLIDERFQLVVAPFDGEHLGPRRQLTRGAGHVAFPVWSPRGEALLVLTRTVRDNMQYGTRYGRVHLWLVLGDGSAPLQLTEGGSLSLRRPVWTDDGIWLVARTEGPPYGRAVWRITLSEQLQAKIAAGS